MSVIRTSSASPTVLTKRSSTTGHSKLTSNGSTLTSSPSTPTSQHQQQLLSKQQTSLSLDEFKPGTEVTALIKYNGKSDEHELSFEYGDLMRIVKIVHKDPKWALCELRGKQGYVALNCVKLKQQTMPWFHGNLTREQAEFLLKDLPEGSYLIRESMHYPGDFTLCLKSDCKVENYHIKQTSKKFTIDDDNSFANLIELIEFYTKNDHLACLLSNPIKSIKKKESSDYQAILDSLWLDENEIKLGKEIGIGEYGAVYRGTYRNSDIAVKKIKDRTAVDEFMKEALVMSTLSHPNLVKLIGVIKHQSNNSNSSSSSNQQSEKLEISIVTEFMPKGSLLDYLTSRGRSVLGNKDLIEFAIHVCDAMSYLEERGIVHRDLAASNVLVSKDDVAKVSDFGLAKKIMDENKNSGLRIRIKWAAPEAIKDKLYSNKSDMWSFGIFLWEMFSYGRVPYPKIPVNEVLYQIEQGYQMEKPDGCPDDIYALMRETWHKDRTLRPTFSQTLHKLIKLKTKLVES